MTDSVYLESAADVSLYTKAFDHLRALALSPDRSASFMHAILKEHSR
ncbi:Scr1 family TA system antitoxin-like transcriptional regulator [Streptomyces laculatispora]|uniref:Scr1 family TA system antitoxin-like transcriptional regulator n=1 Tax=Streptomyces laculatispora TaxID=887464 RepID=A0ABY9IEQ0_9ACTN|nr:Scr1 family TA system antitoxin-like transcriptional regulator [Streptomyces laculatispora]WLQ45422.1 Scr1 family TA system antitoxin-like transcriptional regulator [Streptomyces laculatispora]